MNQLLTVIPTSCQINTLKPVAHTITHLQVCPLTHATSLKPQKMMHSNVIKTTKNLGFKMNINKSHYNFINPSSQESKTIPWYLRACCDTVFASDPDKRLSVTGFLVYFCGALMSWKSKLQRSPTLSSTESEYIVMSDVVREIMYARNILYSLGITVGLPIVVKVDNLGAIYVANNAGISVRIKNVDIHCHFVR